MEGARDGGGGEGEDIDLRPQGLDPLLLPHPEAVLLVDDQQSQIAAGEAAVQEFVGADEDVDAPGLEPLQHVAAFGGGAQPRDHVHRHRPVGEAVAEVFEVLARQQGGGHQHEHLAARRHGDEGGAHRHLGLAEAHVAAHQPIHGVGREEVAPHRLDGVELVWRFLEGKLGAESLVVRPRIGEGVPRAGRAAGVHRQELRGGVADSLRRPPPGARPLLAAQPVEGRGDSLAGAVAAEQVELVHRHVELRPHGVLQGDELLGDAVHLQGDETAVAAHPVVGVDHRCAR
ncbi:MAG: hypothetical protein KatS3mg124_0091 [Porticoccaceae bacterium]|nr:MAG: hypothetical protein KatS3mg124_0091 [Porticoccaceae bacterium]